MRSSTIFLHLGVAATIFINLPLLEARPQTAEAIAGPERVFHLGDRGGSIKYPLGWSPHHYANLHELWNTPPERLANLQPDERETVARIETTVIPCAGHAEAVRRLREIEAEWRITSTFITIGGWPALQRRQLVPKPRVSVRSQGASVAKERLVMVTTAVAAGATLVRLDGFAPESVSPQVVDQMESIGRALHPDTEGDPEAAAREVEELRNGASLRMPRRAPGDSLEPERNKVSPMPAEPVPGTVTTGDAINLGTFNLQIGSESEIAVSTNGTNIVVAQQCAFRNSTNGGATFPNSGFDPGVCTGGDSSVAFGRSGNFYWDTIGSNNATCPHPPAVNNCNNIQQMARSTTNGVSFANLATVIDCQVTAGCGFGNIPDQGHIGADRVNAGGSGDQVYLVFRKGFGYGIQCSQDSGANWTAVAYHTGGAIDFPRITVGQNGTVYVVTHNGNNINLDSFSSCANGLAQNLNQVAIATGVNAVACPVAGLDRCNDGNTLRSHTLAVDDTNSNHLYAAYAVNTAAGNPGNDNVLVQDSTDGGMTWRPAVQVNQVVNGRRYEPWVCATGGRAAISWQDRRASTAGSNDSTDYFGSTAFLSGGNLTAGTDFMINGAADPQCASGWPCLTRSVNDSESCSTQPQLAGSCRHSPNNPTDSNTPCDFSGPDATVCPMNETCQGGGGCPKYGDYTGNACVLGRLLAAWPSATAQPGATPTGGFISSFFALTVVGPTPTTTKHTGATTGDFHDDVLLSATLVLGGTSIPIAGQLITFTVGGQSCTGITNASGFASCSLTLNQVPGAYTVTASFAGLGNYQASSDSKAFTITKEETTTTYAGPTVIANGVNTPFSAVLKEDGFVPIAGRTITITLGTGGGAQTCTGTTDATGKAACTILVNQPGGAGTVAANFAGDAFYLPSSATAATTLFSFLAQGSFVLGNLTATGAVEFWGDDWADVNVLSGRPASHAFKGFAASTTEPPACGSTWTSRPGNSSDPPAPPLPSFMGVIVSTTVSKSGPTISGNVFKIVVVKTNPGYEPNPGHHGTGTVVATFCQ
jgi:hypothetical protein